MHNDDIRVWSFGVEFGDDECGIPTTLALAARQGLPRVAQALEYWLGATHARANQRSKPHPKSRAMSSSTH